jgi:phosphatidylserine/phosphatidylglycerophosphate/cardiolipin synthase-like enzyme
MSRGPIDEISLFASPADVALRMSLRSTWDVVSELVVNAEKSIFISCYELSSIDLGQLLKDAILRGVHVDVHMSWDVRKTKDETGRFSRSERNVLGTLREKGAKISITEMEGSYNHTKAIIADRQQGIIGSANFSKSGLTKNFEIGLFVRGPTCAHLIDQFGNLE